MRAPASRPKMIIAWIGFVLFAVVALRYLSLVISDSSNGGSWFALICFSGAAIGSCLLAATLVRKPSP